MCKAPRLRVVGRAGVGVDNIDLDAATHRGIVVMNTPGGNAASVAEHALALMLSMARSVPQLNAAMHAGRWEKSGAAGAELRGKTLGLVGLGRVGAEVARRAQGAGDASHGPRSVSESGARGGIGSGVAGAAGLARASGLRFAAHSALSSHGSADECADAWADEARRATGEYGARRTGGRGGVGRSTEVRATFWRGAGRICRRAAEGFAAAANGQRDRDAARRGIDGRGAGRSWRADRAAGARLSGGWHAAQRREFAGDLAGSISPAAPLPGIDGAAGVLGGAGGAIRRWPGAHGMRGRASRTGHAHSAERGAGGRAERRAGRAR